jgi:hypothetical protein
MFTANARSQLTPVASEFYGTSVGASYFSLAVVDKAFCDRLGRTESGLANLKGARSCHTGYRKTAGWTVPVGFMASQVRPRMHAGAAPSSVLHPPLSTTTLTFHPQHKNNPPGHPPRRQPKLPGPGRRPERGQLLLGYVRAARHQGRPAGRRRRLGGDVHRLPGECGWSVVLLLCRGAAGGWCFPTAEPLISQLTRRPNIPYPLNPPTNTVTPHPHPGRLRRGRRLWRL